VKYKPNREEKMEIKGILITSLVPFENHIANGGEKLFGNASSIKRRPDGCVYVSGQMQRHVLFSAIDRLNFADLDKGETFVSNGDGVTPQIEKDLRADMGGFMLTKKGLYSKRRTAPLSVTPAVAVEKSEVGQDLLVRMCLDESGDAKDQALATKEYSQHDMMRMNFFLDVSALSVTKRFKYENNFNIKTFYVKHVNDVERKRRAKLYIQATKSMNDYANQARNAVSGEPQQVLIVCDTVLSRKAIRYFIAEEQEKENILAELKDRGAVWFLGDDTTKDSVLVAYTKALDFLKKTDSALFDPSMGGEIRTFEECFSCSDESKKSKRKV
jgi:CRISPR-associated protein Cst2